MFKRLVFSISLTLLAILAIRCSSARNEKKVKMDTAINAWADVETAYRERADKVTHYVDIIRKRLSDDAITFLNIEQQLKDAQTASIMVNGGLDMSAETLRKYILKQSASLGFLSWAAENKDRLDANLLVSLQSTLEQSENNIRQAKLKYNKAADAYNKLETDESKELPTQF